MRRFRWKKIIANVFAVAVCGAVIYKFSPLSIKTKTEIALRSESKDIVQAKGLVLRSEEILNNDSLVGRSNLRYVFGDGERVAKNGIIADVYTSSDDAQISYSIDRINGEIEVLQKLDNLKNNLSHSINSINAQVFAKISDYNMAMCSYDVLNAEKLKCDLLYELNEKKVILGEDLNIGEKIDALIAEKNSLVGKSSPSVSKVYSPSSGVFLNKVDGYENVLEYKDILKMDLSTLDINGLTPAMMSGSEIGKIIKSETWYIVCTVNSQDACKFNVGHEIKMKTSSMQSDKFLPCIVERKCKLKDSDDYIVVVSCQNMNKDLGYLRTEDFKFILNEYEGIKFPKAALHMPEKDFGVYVKVGKYLKFKKAVPCFFYDDYVVCRYDCADCANDKYVQQGDRVVVGGTNLYHGKPVA